MKAVDNSAAVAGSTFKPAAICGMTGSTERMNSDVAKITNAMRLRTRPMRAGGLYVDQRFASRSNSTSVRSSGSISLSGIMLGPSDGARSGS